jgi:hypothetical protein
MTLTGKNLIACAPVESADGHFTASGALARFEETSAAQVGQAVEIGPRGPGLPPSDCGRTRRVSRSHRR